MPQNETAKANSNAMVHMERLCRNVSLTLAMPSLRTAHPLTLILIGAGRGVEQHPKTANQ